MPGEVWLCAVEEFDAEDRVEDEEYYAVVESVDMTEDDLSYVVQDVGEESGPETISANRYICL